jgi:hypothetical protein
MFGWNLKSILDSLLVDRFLYRSLRFQDSFLLKLLQLFSSSSSIPPHRTFTVPSSPHHSNSLINSPLPSMSIRAFSPFNSSTHDFVSLFHNPKKYFHKFILIKSFFQLSADGHSFEWEHQRQTPTMVNKRAVI